MRRSSLLLALLLLVGIVLTPAVWGKTVVVRVNARNYQELYDHVPFKGTTIDVAGAQPGKTYDLTLDESDLGLVRSCGLQSQVIVPDLDYWQSLEGSFGYYQSFDSMMSVVKHLAAAYPGICALESIGPSYESRWIYGLKITQNPQVEDPSKPEMLLYGQIHAREWGAGQMARHVMDTLVRYYASNPAFQNWIDNHQLWIFPIFNCDGFSYDYPGQVMWRKNRQPFGGSIGTDMNRDGNGACQNSTLSEFGALVSGSRTSNDPSDETFMGARGAYAPEVKSLTNLFRQHTFLIDLSFHTYSELVLWPWGQNGAAPDGSFMTTMGQQAAAQIGALGGGNYYPEQSVGLYPTNCSVEDWFYGWAHTVGGFPCPSYTFECGTTFYQPTSDLDGMAVQVFKGFWVMANHLDSIASNLHGMVPGPNVAHIDTSVDGNYTIHWTPVRPARNTPDKWELEELQNLTVVTDDIENTGGNWTLQGATVSTTQKHSGAKSLFLGNTSNMDNWAVTKDPYPVISASDSVTCWVWYNLETDYDIGVIEVSLEGKDWTQLHDRFTGNSSGWVRKAYSLAPWLGKSVYIRVRAASDDGTNSGGMYVDDIYPVPAFANRTTISNTITDTLYPFTAKPDGHYYYRVRGHNTAWNWGDQSWLQDVQVGASGVADSRLPPVGAASQPRTALAVGPNPFSSRTQVNYTLGRTGSVKLGVYDESGKLVRELVSASREPGDYSVTWDGRDQTGRKLANGVYVIRLEADRTFTRQILMLH